MFKIFSLSDLLNSPKDREFYTDLANEYGDTYYNLDYLNTNEICENGKCHVAILSFNSIVVLYPFILREISPKFSSNKNYQNIYDIITPYEYGGPLLCANSENVELESVSKKFDSEFINFCVQNNVVTEVVRFNPILNNHLPWRSSYEISKLRENIIVNITESNETILSNYHKNKRRDIRSAVRKGVSIHKSNNADDLIQFEQIYFETMNRNLARSFYYFSKSYFKALYNLSGKNLVSLYLAKNNVGKVIAASFFLHSNRIVHYHLSGSNKAYSNLLAQNLLLHSVIIEMKNLGCKLIHLGGAALSQSGLYSFKSGYSPYRADYYLGKRIHNVNIYKELCEQWLQHNNYKEESNNYSNDFFPFYRKSI